MRNIFILLLALSLLTPAGAYAATLFVTPASGGYETGDTITAKVAVSSDVSVNAVSSSLSFSTDTLSLSSISKSGSFINFWAQEPAFSNTSGTVQFEGASLGTGYSGASGTVLTLTFRAKAAGTGSVSFISGSVLANDGQGTDVTSGRSGATFTISGASEQPPKPKQEEAPVSAGTGEGISILSSTHSDQSKWYDNDSPRFYWNLPSNASEVRILLDENSKSTPTKSYTPAISSKVVEDLPDGTYYFHLQVKSGSGWSAVSHFKVNIDTSQPRSFSVVFPHGISSLNPQPVILFNTEDNGSGIAYYEVKIGDGGPLKAAAAADSNPYALPLLDPGKYVVYVTAHDEAGNTTTAESEFTIEGIDPPKVTSYPTELNIGDLFKVRGTTYPNATVELNVYEKDGKLVFSESTKSNSLGDFGVTLSKRLLPGEYTFTVRVTDERGARSPATSAIPFTVSLHLIADVLAFVANYFVIVVIFLLGVGGIAAFGIWGVARLHYLQTKLHREVTEAETTIRKSFAILKGDLSKHIKRLHTARRNRPLTEDELMFLEDFEKDLEEAEHIIQDEVDDIPR